MSKNGVPDPSVLQGETVWLEANKYCEAEEHFHSQTVQAPVRQPVQAPVRQPIPAKKNPACMALVETDHVVILDEALVENEPAVIPAKKNPGCIALVESNPAVIPAKKNPGCMAILGEGHHKEIPSKKNPAEISLPILSPKKGDYEGDYISSIVQRVQKLEKDRAENNQKIDKMNSTLEEILRKVHELSISSPEAQISIQQVKPVSQNGVADEKVQNGDDDDLDLFGSDEETDKELQVKQERLKEYETKKAKKPAIVAKSSVVLDIKPWNDETDMEEMEKVVKGITADGLKWGAAKLVPLAYGIKKLQIVAIVEDDKVSIDWLQESIEEIEDLVQSVDIAAFNKL